jgi:hypothetical protein
MNNKLDYCWIGPFRVEEMVGPNAVRLDIKQEYPLLHPMFNVSLLTCYYPPQQFHEQRSC